MLSFTFELGPSLIDSEGFVIVIGQELPENCVVSVAKTVEVINKKIRKINPPKRSFFIILDGVCYL